MRKIYNKYFHIPKQGEGSMHEKVFFSRLALSVVCIVLCMAAMGFNAYAFFTVNVSSSSNVIQASTYTAHVEEIKLVPEGQGSATKDETAPYKYKLTPGQYDFKLVKQGNATTGYCRIDVIQGETVNSFYTQQMGVVDEKGTEVDNRTVTITVKKEAVVQFVGCWGTYSGTPFDEQKDMILIDENGKATTTTLMKATATSTLSVEDTNISEQKEPEQEESKQKGTEQQEPEQTVETPATDEVVPPENPDATENEEE